VGVPRRGLRFLGEAISYSAVLLVAYSSNQYILLFLRRIFYKRIVGAFHSVNKGHTTTSELCEKPKLSEFDALFSNLNEKIISSKTTKYLSLECV